MAVVVFCGRVALFQFVICLRWYCRDGCRLVNNLIKLNSFRILSKASIEFVDKFLMEESWVFSWGKQ